MIVAITVFPRPERWDLAGDDRLVDAPGHVTVMWRPSASTGHRDHRLGACDKHGIAAQHIWEVEFRQYSVMPNQG